MSDVLATALVVSAGPFLVGLAALLQARSNGKEMRTNDGRRAGEYIETTNAAVLDHGIQLERFRRDLADTTTIVREHVATDLESFKLLHEALGIEGNIVQTLKAQDRAAEQVRVTLLEAEAKIKSSEVL